MRECSSEMTTTPAWAREACEPLRSLRRSSAAAASVGRWKSMYTSEVGLSL